MEMGSSAPEAAVPSGICAAGAGIPHRALLPLPTQLPTQPARALPELEFVALNTFPGTRQVFKLGWFHPAPSLPRRENKPPIPHSCCRHVLRGSQPCFPLQLAGKYLGAFLQWEE